MTRHAVCFVATAAVLAASSARADEPLALRVTHTGAHDVRIIGGSLTEDGPDADTTRADVLQGESMAELLAGSVPPGAELVQGWLYWAGTIGDTSCSPSGLDRDVQLWLPTSIEPHAVAATSCTCSLSDAASYDVQACKADITGLFEDRHALAGEYWVGDFDAQVNNGATDNASFALVLVFTAPGQRPRRIGLYDGLMTMSAADLATHRTTLSGLEVDNPAKGELTWYVLEGDTGGSGSEEVRVTGLPSGGSLVVADADNPATNPMNHTITTQTPARDDVIGVDLDRFDISAALDPGDQTVQIDLSAGTDKWWSVFNVLAIDVFEAVLRLDSWKSGVLRHDHDDNGQPSPGDVVRYTLHLFNRGTAPALVELTDPLLAPATQVSIAGVPGGTVSTSGNIVHITDLAIAPGTGVDVVFDVTLGDTEDETLLTNTATFDARPDGDNGTLVAPAMLVRRDLDGDGVFDHDDNCPLTPNPTQTPASCSPCPRAKGDSDGDGLCDDVDNCADRANPNQADRDADGAGDACDACPETTAATCWTSCADDDQDGRCNEDDNCPGEPNPAQEDHNSDGMGDACDPCPLENDSDEDGHCDSQDNCPQNANTAQSDADHDGRGDACDAPASQLEPANVTPESDATTSDGNGGDGAAGPQGCGCSAHDDRSRDAWTWLAIGVAATRIARRRTRR